MKITQPKSMPCQHDTKTYPFYAINSQYLHPSAHGHFIIQSESSLILAVPQFF